MKLLFSRQLLVIVFILFSSINNATADTVWIDVRTAEEYAENNIPGDLNISHTMISEEIGKHVTDKNTEIKLYCRSGKRAGMAMLQLKEMGYTNVSNMGGIDDVKLLRAENKSK